MFILYSSVSSKLSFVLLKKKIYIETNKFV